MQEIPNVSTTRAATSAPEPQEPRLRVPPLVKRVFYVALGLGLLTYLFFLGRELVSRIRPNPPGRIFVPYGWAYLLGGLACVVLLILLYSLVYMAVHNRLSGRRRSPWPLFAQGVTHLFLILVVMLVYYPILQVVSASFDPRNTLFSFRPPDVDFILLRARVIPDLSEFSLENYTRLFVGVVIYPYQWLLLAASIASLCFAAGVALYRQVAVSTPRLVEWQTRALVLFGVLLFGLAMSLGPAQFTGRPTESKFLLWLRNTLLVAGLTGFLSVALTASAGYAFARFRSLPGRYPMLLVFIFVQMFPGFLALIAIFYLMSWLQLLNTLTGLVLAYSGMVISFGTWVYKGYLESFGTALEEAAFVDGANRWQAFTRILVPLSGPIFTFIFLLQFVMAYSEFILASLFLSGVESWTIGLGLYNFTTDQFSARWGVFAAASVLGSLPILIVFYGFQQMFVSGYTAGAVKE